MKDDFLIPSEILRRTSLRPYHFKQLREATKSSLLTELDNTTHDVQLLLRANIEAFYNNCRFIFTCNYKNKIIEPLHSRCAVIEFGLTNKQRPAIAAKFFQRLKGILDQETVEYDEKVLVGADQQTLSRLASCSE